MKRYKPLLLLLLVALAFSFTACGNDTTSSKKKDTLVIATENEPPSLTTCEHDSLSGVFMNMMTYNGLVKFNMENLDPELDLASDYRIENDVDWIFELKEDVKFHDGTNMTAEDVKASLEWAKTFPESQNYTSKIKVVEVVDDYTVKITTDGPYAGLLYDLGYHFNFIVPKNQIDSGNDFNKNPIGSGPYILKEWKHGDSISFEAFDDYFDKDHKAKIKNVIWRFIPEGTSRTIALEAGEVDFVYEVETTDIERLQKDDNYEVAEVTSVVNWFLNLNLDIAPYDDVNFRKAINSAINRDEIISSALNGFGVPSIACAPMGYTGASEKNANGYDLKKAKEYLDAWGGDVSEVKLPILCSNDTKVRVSTVLQSNLSEIGLDVEIVSLDLATYLEQMSRGDYVASITSWSPSNALTYLQRFHSRRNDTNPGSLHDSTVDNLVEDAESELDAVTRTQRLEEIAAAVNELCPQPSLYQDVIYRAYNKGLAGVVPSATGYIYINDIYWKD